MATELHQSLGEACQVEEENDSYALSAGNYIARMAPSDRELTGGGTVEVEARVKITFLLKS
jgi:hypothetical protein